MTPETADTIALKALAFLASDDEALGAFLTQSGMAVDELKQAAGNRDILAGVMDFILSDEASAQAFCLREDIKPEHCHQARALLPGGDNPHWT